MADIPLEITRERLRVDLLFLRLERTQLWFGHIVHPDLPREVLAAQCCRSHREGIPRQTIDQIGDYIYTLAWEHLRIPWSGADHLELLPWQPNSG